MGKIIRLSFGSEDVAPEETTEVSTAVRQFETHDKTDRFAQMAMSVLRGDEKIIRVTMMVRYNQMAEKIAEIQKLVTTSFSKEANEDHINTYTDEELIEFIEMGNDADFTSKPTFYNMVVAEIARRLSGDSSDS